MNYENFTIKNDFPFSQQFNSHCQKCGRRRKYINNSEQSSYYHQLKSYREVRPFPTEQSSIQNNDNHSIINKKDQIQKMKSVQQMIYLRENINNLSYREIHYSNQYIILKRLEEKNSFINQNHINVDQYFRSFKLQYQTISTLYQTIPITSFIYSEKENFIIKPYSIEESLIDQSTLNITSIDSPILIKSQQYSQNTNYLTQTKKKNLNFESTVMIDIKKHSLIDHQSSITAISDISSSISLMNITNEKKNQIIEKIKQLLNNLRKKLLKKLSTSNLISTDSLITTHSISSNNNYYSNQIKFPYYTRNMNNNQQNSDDDDETDSKRSRFHYLTIEYMSPVFMFILQILLLTCLFNRIIMQYFFGIMPTDIQVSILIDQTQSSTSISTETDEKFKYFFNFIKPN